MFEKNIPVSVNVDVILPDDYEYNEANPNDKSKKKTFIYLDNGKKKKATAKDYK